jgi:hypothetical protein
MNSLKSLQEFLVPSEWGKWYSMVFWILLLTQEDGLIS